MSVCVSRWKLLSIVTFDENNISLVVSRDVNQMFLITTDIAV